MSCTTRGAAATPGTLDSLRRAALAWHQARTGPRSAGDALWHGLLAGRWRLLDAFMADGARYIVACRNPEPTASLCALVPRERIVLELALAGHSGKYMALELNLSESVVARTLGMALHKLGVADTAALAGVPTAVFEPVDGVDGVELAIARTAPAARSLQNLSGAERAIVADMLGGKRITAIAHERGTSPRTVAHQIGNVYRKLGASSRRELLALLA